MKNYCEWCHQADEKPYPTIKVITKAGGQVYCPECEREILLLTIPRAAQVAGVSRVTIYDWIRKGRISFVVNAAGHRKVCYSSLYQPPKPKTEDEKYVDALSERVKGSGLRVCRKKAA